MGYAYQIVADYLRRRNVPPDSGLDALHQYEMTVLRDMLDRLEVILDDEGVPRDIAVRVIRCMLYGSPSPAAAEERMRREAEMVKLLNERPPDGPLEAPPDWPESAAAVLADEVAQVMAGNRPGRIAWRDGWPYWDPPAGEAPGPSPAAS